MTDFSHIFFVILYSKEYTFESYTEYICDRVSATLLRDSARHCAA
jgi:hypothetical protein